MKNETINDYSMKKTIKFLAMILSLTAVTIFTACDGGEDDKKIDDLINNGPDLADGWYIVGSAVSADTTAANSLVQGQVNAPDFGKQDRPGFFEAYIYMGSGEFSFIKVEGDDVTALGGSTTAEVDGDPVEIAVHVGALTADGTGTSPVNGKLCHVTIDEETNEFLIIPIDFWEIIGDATADGWGAGQEMAQKSASADEVVFEATNVTLRGPGSYKFRYNANWSMPREEGECDAATVACYNFFTNFGGTLDALVHGGSNLAFDGEDGAYTVTVTYAPAAGRSMSASIVKTGDVEPLPEYPEAMYLVGAATAYGWETPGTVANAVMHKLANGAVNEGLYWKILSLTANTGFKVSAANWSAPNLGFGEVTEFDANGVTVSNDGDGNMAVAADGVYMVVLDLRNETTKISVTEAAVHGIGAAFTDTDGVDPDDTWTMGREETLFTIDVAAKTVTSPALSVSGDTFIRMYAHHAWITDWWTAEFIVINDVIEYRNDGGDQERVAGSDGQVITLSFDDNTGSIQ